MGIVVKELVKEFESQRAVDNITFEAKAGEILGFLGPNGAGKSTTMKMATCYLPPTSGSIEVCGYNVVQNPIEVREEVGYLPEHNPLYLDMYVHEYLKFIASIHHIKGRKSKERVADMVALVGLTREQHKKIGALSKGYRQRVGLAQTLIHDPKVLILDEPTTGLDPNQIVEIREVIKNISKDKTVVFSTHIMQEVKALCDRVVIIDQGKIVADSEVGKLQKGSSETKVSIEFETVPPVGFFEGFREIRQVEQQALNKFMLLVEGENDIRANLFRKAVQDGLVIIGLHQEEVSLENIFQNLTKYSREN